MFCLRLYTLLAFSLQAVLVTCQLEQAEDDKTKLTTPSSSANLKVSVSASFPQSEIFGIKLVNGHPTQAILSVHNEEPNPITVAYVGGTLSTEVGSQMSSVVVRNLTITPLNVVIPAGQAETLTYSFSTEMHPQELRLNIFTMVTDGKDLAYSISAFNGTVSVVEAPTSIFDPQMIFLYMILGSAFLGTCYFVYNTWITTFFPQKRRGGKGGERAKTSSGRSKKVDPADQVSVIGADGPAVTSGAKAYDESWIPVQHLQKPEARRVKSGAGVAVKTKQRD